MLWEDCLFPAFLLQNKTDTAGNTNGKYSFASWLGVATETEEL